MISYYLMPALSKRKQAGHTCIYLRCQCLAMTVEAVITVSACVSLSGTLPVRLCVFSLPAAAIVIGCVLRWKKLKSHKEKVCVGGG